MRKLGGLALLGLLALGPAYSDAGADDALVREPLPSPEEIAMLPADGGSEFNRLIHEKSPYLLQHARNPVDWYPWGDEAFAAAKQQGKLVFLSVGYSTCHWCHVMERESFEKDEIGRVMNKHFISIKVDREERPDVDDVYMKATQLMTGGGGWPNSVWLTPEGKPIFAGTYFPPEDSYGRPGFKTVLLSISEQWNTNRQRLEEFAGEVSTAMEENSAPQFEASGSLDRSLLGKATDALRQSFDERLGGFGGAPKFPPHGSLRLLFYEYRETKNDRLLEMATRTLDAMANGGIRDHVGGGFHRYATDDIWFLPHFEKMLYDNAQLSLAYVDAYLITGQENYRDVAVDAYEWVLREMQDSRGGFYSALDADSEGVEGKFYLFTEEEVAAILGAGEGAFFSKVYSFEEGGNYYEQATGEKPGTNIVYLKKPLEDVAKQEGVGLAELRQRLKKDREKILKERVKRVWPHLDDKVLVSWNGLMIGSLAYGGRHLNEPRYITAAERAADFILANMREGGRLLRTYREGEAKLNAYLDDYTFLADGLLELYEATGESRWLDEAQALMEQCLEHHRDKLAGGFFYTSDDHEELLLRAKSPFDEAIPSANGMAARVLVRLGNITGDSRYSNLAEDSFSAFLGAMQEVPRATESLVLAAGMFFDQATSPGDGAVLASAPSSGGLKPDARLRRAPLTIEALASQLKLAPGAEFQVALRLSLDPGWHVNSHSPLQDYLVPTAVNLQQTAAATLGGVDYPPGQQISLAFSPEALSVYDGTTVIVADLSIADDAPAGAADLAFDVDAQVCDDRSCLAAETYTITIRVEIGQDTAGGGRRDLSAFISSAISSSGGASAGTGADGGALAQQEASGGSAGNGGLAKGSMLGRLGYLPLAAVALILVLIAVFAPRYIRSLKARQ
ncbi:DUF255 domain-containing protein [bacterium]|nr:DUF255 domain-containing protein [bacterium]